MRTLRLFLIQKYAALRLLQKWIEIKDNLGQLNPNLALERIILTKYVTIHFLNVINPFWYLIHLFSVM